MAVAGGIAMRDAKLDRGPVLLFTGVAWHAFLDGLRAGQFQPE
jgi:hypothetical protein